MTKYNKGPDIKKKIRKRKTKPAKQKMAETNSRNRTDLPHRRKNFFFSLTSQVESRSTKETGEELG